jgi:hypothetical protein
MRRRCCTRVACLPSQAHTCGLSRVAIEADGTVITNLYSRVCRMHIALGDMVYSENVVSACRSGASSV